MGGGAGRKNQGLGWKVPGADAVLKVGGDDQQPLLDEVEDGGRDEAAGVVAGGLPVWRGVELGLAVGRLHGIVDEGGGLVGVDLGHARGGRGCASGCRLVAVAGWVRVDAGEGELPAGSAERLALRRLPELGAFRADVLGYLAVEFQVSHLRGDGAEVGVEPVSYRFLHVESHDGAVSLFDVVLYGVPDLRGVC